VRNKLGGSKMANKKWIVLWVKGGRVGSFPLTKKKLEQLKKQFHLGLIQRDITGTEHYNIEAVRRKTRKKAGR